MGDTKTLGSTAPVVFDGVVSTKESTLQVGFDLPLSDRTPPSSAEGVKAMKNTMKDFNDVLGNLGVSHWKPAAPLTPEGNPLKATGGFDPKLAETLYHAVLTGDVETVARTLGVAEAEGEEAPAAAPAKPDGPWSLVDVYGIEPLAHACELGHLAVVKALLDAGVDVEAKSPEQMTALHRAARGKHEQQKPIIESLIAASAFVDAESVDGMTPLQAAALAGRVDAVEALLAGGAALAHVDALGITPLMATAMGGSAACAEAMLAPELGCVVDARDANGWSALHHACAEGHAEVALLLAERGADVDAATRGGRKVADFDGGIADSLLTARAARQAREAAEAEAAAAQAEE